MNFEYGVKQEDENADDAYGNSFKNPAVVAWWEDVDE